MSLLVMPEDSYLLDERTCHGCLGEDRKTKVLEASSKERSFFQFFREVSSTVADQTPVILCWECEAYLRRFIKFKLQVQKSYETMLDHVKMHTKPESRFRINTIYKISILPSSEDPQIAQFEIIKTEDICSDIKQEFLEETIGYSDNYSEDDDKVLLEVKTRKKKVKEQNRRKKRKKTEKQPQYNQTKIDSTIYTEVELTEKEIEEEKRQLSLKEDYTDALYKCEKCIVSFPNVHYLNDHIKIKHEMHASSKYKCAICTCTFASDVTYNYHVNKHRRRFQCLDCDLRFTSKRAVSNHYKDTHSSRQSDNEADMKEGILENEKTETILNNSSTNGTTSFTCQFCDKSFKWKTSLRKHMDTHKIEAGQKRRPYCDPCRLSFSSTSTLQNHVKSSSKHQIQLKLRKLKDSFPDNGPESQQACIEEIKTKINSSRQRYPCSQCDKKFQWRGNLLRHLQSHQAKANGELECKPCNRTFSSIATYRQHLKISRKHVTEDDYNYICSECGRRFADKTRLTDHINWEHHKNYVHKCQICQKVFKSHTSLYLHGQVAHKNGTEHLCDHCGKPFPTRSKLRIHMMALHAAGPVYSCGKCDARFNWHSCLSRHTRRVHKSRGQNGLVAEGGSA